MRKREGAGRRSLAVARGRIVLEALPSPPGGYGRLHVTSPEDARQKVEDELDEGADLIKVTMEDGYGPASNLPLMSFGELTAIVGVAHERGALVSAHVTEAALMQTVVDAGVDDVAHVPRDSLPDALMEQAIAADVLVVNGDPLEDLAILTDVSLVIHGGAVIRSEGR